MVHSTKTVSYHRVYLPNMHIAHLSTLFSLAIGANSIPTAARPQKPVYLPKRLIALEEHVVSPSLEAEVLASGLTQQYPGILEKMKDVGAVRLAAMDAGHVSMQVLAQQSASGLEDAAACRSANDAIKAAKLNQRTTSSSSAVDCCAEMLQEHFQVGRLSLMPGPGGFCRSKEAAAVLVLLVLALQCQPAWL